MSKGQIQKKLKRIRTISQNQELINKVEKEFKVEKELMLVLANRTIGTYGKNGYLTSLATLSFDNKDGIFYK